MYRSEYRFLIVRANDHLEQVSEPFFYLFGNLDPLAVVGNDELDARQHFFQQPHQQKYRFTVVDICRRNHHGNQKAVFVHNDMSSLSPLLFCSHHSRLVLVCSPILRARYPSSLNWLLHFDSFSLLHAPSARTRAGRALLNPTIFCNNNRSVTIWQSRKATAATGSPFYQLVDRVPDRP